MVRLFIPVLVGLCSTARVAFAETCSWCEAGDSTCDWTYSDFKQVLFLCIENLKKKLLLINIINIVEFV